MGLSNSLIAFFVYPVLKISWEHGGQTQTPPLDGFDGLRRASTASTATVSRGQGIRGGKCTEVRYFSACGSKLKQSKPKGVVIIFFVFDFAKVVIP